MLEVTKIAIEEHQVVGVAVSGPGGVDSETGIIGGASALPCIHGPNFKEIFKNELNINLEIENDANCAGLGEVWLGGAKDNQDATILCIPDRKSTRLNSSHNPSSRMPSSA